ncbi:zinc uptake protein ZrgA [Halovulum sp. GXIMD14793]
MKPMILALLTSVAATPLLAQEKREMDAHAHGVSTLQIASEDGGVEMNLLSPGMDIVGFEYAASTDADKDAVEAALRALLVPENIITLPEAAECRLAEVMAHLHGGDHDHHDGEEHHEDHEGHDHGKDDHDHEDHDHGEGDAHHDHEESAEHSEFHVRYKFDCEHPEKLTTVGFPFFARFENAQEIEATYATDAGTGTAEIGRDAAELSLN